MITSLKHLMTKMLLKAVYFLDKNYQRPTVILTTPSNGIEQLMAQVDRVHGDLINRPTVPTDSLALIQYRAGAKTYREQLLKAINDNSKESITAGLKR